MKTENILFYAFLSLLFSLLFIGFYRSDEFDDLFIFLKYRPTFKSYFYTPIGMNDIDFSQLNMSERNDERYYDEFIRKNLFKNKFLELIPYLLIQSTITLFLFGLIPIFKVKFWKIPTHIILNSCPTIFGIAFILTFDKWFMTIFIGGILLAINIFTLKILTWKDKVFNT